jgi:hypothetical protein
MLRATTMEARMAISYTKIGCRRCGGFVTAHGLLCANCTKRGDGLKTFLLGMITLQGLVIGGIYCWNRISKPGPGEIQHVVDSAPPTASEAEARLKHQGWFYYVTRDERLDDTTRHARLVSTVGPAAREAPPIDTDGTLELRTSDIYGRSAVLTIDRRPTDNSADQATLAVKFDDRPTEEFAANETADDASISVAVSDYNKFTTAMQSAHAMVVDAQLGARTQRVLRFQVAGLTW